MIDLSKLELTEMPDPTEAELLEEAKAWGYDTIEEWSKMMDDVMTEYWEFQNA